MFTRISFLMSVVIINAEDIDVDLKFPAGFKFGAATAAYQVEGAWNASDKGENIWDHFTHVNPNAISDGSNGDVACDSYQHWLQDVQMVKDLGLHFYRFSISWSRLLPSGFDHYVSKDGANYYNNLIDELLRRNIEPLVTIYHFDLPQTLQNLGGWTNPLVVDWFADYAKVVFELFSDRVKTWITFNEPVAICAVTYSEGAFAPGILEEIKGEYICGKNVILAHAKAWRIYDTKFKPKHKGKVAIANQILWYQASTTDNDQLADLANQYSNGRFFHPIYSEVGGWPPSIEEIIRNISISQGFKESRLPEFTKEEIDFVKGTYDFVGLNYYTSRVVRKPKTGEKLERFFTGTDIPILGIKAEALPEWSLGAVSFFANYPEGLRKAMNWVISQYGPLEFFITEIGYCDYGLSLDDSDRIAHMKGHLEQVLLSIHKDEIKITGFSYWALMDNFEWADGYKAKFGLYEVDFQDPNRTRTARKSAYYYSSVIKHNSLAVSVQPQGWSNPRKVEVFQNSDFNVAKYLIPNFYVILVLLFFINNV